MNGYHSGLLRAYVRVSGGPRRVCWQMHGDQLNGWKSADIELNMTSVTEVSSEIQVTVNAILFISRSSILIDQKQFKDKILSLLFTYGPYCWGLVGLFCGSFGFLSWHFFGGKVHPRVENSPPPICSDRPLLLNEMQHLAASKAGVANFCSSFHTTGPFTNNFWWRGNFRLSV